MDLPRIVRDAHLSVLDRAGYTCELEERFDTTVLDTGRWLPEYLPHWTTTARASARYDISADGLRLRIDADQPAWRADEGELRVSNLQTGSLSGPVGSNAGQHRYKPGLQVVTATPPRRLYLAAASSERTCLVEAELRADTDPTIMLALWLIGYEEDPEQSGELCVCEIFGRTSGAQQSTVNVGVKAQNDPTKHDDMREVLLDIDAGSWHTYSVEWDTEQSRFYIDDRLIRTVDQGFGYPMQIMLDLFEFPESATRLESAYPKVGHVRAVRASVRNR